MIDQEKVIKGLEELEGFLFKEYTNIKAEESKIYYDRFKSLSDAIVLLKDHEAVPVKEDKINKCECGETVCRYWHPEYCGFCGKKLEWY